MGRVGSEQGVESLLAALVAVLEAERSLLTQQQQQEGGGASVVWWLGQLLAAMQLLTHPQHVKVGRWDQQQQTHSQCLPA